MQVYKDELYHWGIKGMKWGVRRYQNKDGTLTAAGRKHYAGDGNAGEDAQEPKTEYAPKRPGKNAEDYSDEELRLIIEETEPYFGGCTVAFYLTGTEDEGKAALLAVTDLNEFNVSDDRYKISWAAENTLTVGFEDGANYRQLTIPIDRSHIEE